MPDSWDLSSFLPGKKKNSANGKQEKPSVTTNTTDKFIKETNTKIQEEISTEIDYAKEESTSPTKINIIPLNKQKAIIKEHIKPVSAITLDIPGARLLTGAYDYDLRFYDFNTMDKSLNSFRTICPQDGYFIKDIKFCTKDNFLVATSSCQVKLFNKDGAEVFDYAKGDEYLRDLRNTKGHVAGICGLDLNERDKEWFLSYGLDCTVRVWNVEDKTINKYCIIVKGKPGQGRTFAGVTAACFSKDGKLVCGSSRNGVLSVWDWRRTWIRPQYEIKNAHLEGSDTSRVCFSRDGFSIVTRGGDESVKLFDLRMFSKPVLVRSDLPSVYTETDVMYSPDERFLLTGTSYHKGQGNGKLLLLDALTLKTVEDVEFENEGVIRLAYHEKLNQLFATTNTGSVHGFYDPETSKKGLLLSLSKAVRKRKQETFTNVEDVYLPFSLPMFRQGDDWEPERAKKRRDPVLAHRPEIKEEFVLGKGPKRVVGENEQHMILKHMSKNTSRDIDPREAILRHAKEAEENPYWVNPAYKKTQPKTIYDTSKETKEDDDVHEPERKYK